MKKVYNKYSTSDIPLDASLDLSSGPTPKTNTAPKKKATIQAIGTKAKTVKNTKAAQASSASKGNVRKKIAKDSIDLKELEKLNEESIKSHSFRSKRNQVIIVVLSLLLVLAIAFIIIFAIVTKVENNCFLTTEGAQASYVVNGEELSEFRAPGNIRGDCILEVFIDLKIQESGNFNVKYTVKCYYNDTLLNNVVVYEPNTSENGFTYKSDGYYHSKSPIGGNSTVRLCQGVALNEFDIDLNDKNFRLEVHTYLEKV